MFPDLAGWESGHRAAAVAAAAAAVVAAPANLGGVSLLGHNTNSMLDSGY